MTCVMTQYRRSGNFRAKKLSHDKFPHKKIFVGTIPYHISVNSARVLIFMRLIFVAAINYENILQRKFLDLQYMIAVCM